MTGEADRFILERDSILLPYTHEVAEYCTPFSCEDKDLDDFFSNDAFIYETELLGKTYAWISVYDPSKILCLVTLANDSVKAQFIANSARNRLQRSITNAKRGLNYPAVLIGRLGVSSEFRGKGRKSAVRFLISLKDGSARQATKQDAVSSLLMHIIMPGHCISMKRMASNHYIGRKWKNENS